MLTAYRRPRHRAAPPGSLEGQGWMAAGFNDAIDDDFDVL